MCASKNDLSGTKKVKKWYFFIHVKKKKRLLCTAKEDIPVDRVRGAPEDIPNDGENESDIDFETS